MTPTILLVVIAVTIPAAALLAAGILLRVTGRALPKPRVVEYLPPKGVPILDAALLAGLDKRAVPAALVGMAVDRKIRILAQPDKKAPVAVELQPDAPFTAEDLAVLEALFGPGHSSDRVRRFSKDRRQLSRRVARLISVVEGYLRSHDLLGRRLAWPMVLIRVGAALTLVVGSVILIGSGVNGDWVAFWLTAASVCLALATFVVTPTSWRRYTPASALVREQLAGLNGYITLAEADRLRFLQSPSGALRSASGVTAAGLAVGVPASVDPALAFELDRLILNERLLPYAILFGHSKEWIAELDISYKNVAALNVEGVGAVMEVAGDLLLVAGAVGNLVELASVVGDAVDAGGAVVEVIGAGAEALADLFG
ncbi:MAG: hypothetical protein ABWX56_01335 [Mycetocola sp.]